METVCLDRQTLHEHERITGLGCLPALNGPPAGEHIFPPLFKAKQWTIYNSYLTKDSTKTGKGEKVSKSNFKPVRIMYIQPPFVLLYSSLAPCTITTGPVYSLLPLTTYIPKLITKTPPKITTLQLKFSAVTCLLPGHSAQKSAKQL